MDAALNGDYKKKLEFSTKWQLLVSFKSDLKPQALSVCNCATKAIIEEDSIPGS